MAWHALLVQRSALRRAPSPTAAIVERKQRSFDDFIAAGEFLVEHGYTSPAQLVINGGSNGGATAFAPSPCAGALLSVRAAAQFAAMRVRQACWSPPVRTSAPTCTLPWWHKCQ